jgi:tetratricopeptide (TPR) repeat protein
LPGVTTQSKLYYNALIAFKRDDYDQAIQFIEDGLKQDGEDFRWHELLGQALGLKAQRVGMLKGVLLIPKVKKAFQKAIDLNPQALKAHEGLFLLYLLVPAVAGGDEQKAQEIIEEIRSIDGPHGDMAAAIFQARKNAMPEALQLFKKAADTGSGDAEIQMRAGRFFMEQNHLDMARECLDRCVALRSDDPGNWLALAELYLKSQEEEKALQTLNQIIANHENFIPARLKRAETHIALNRKDEALADYEWICSNHPQSPLAARAKEALRKLK